MKRVIVLSISLAGVSATPAWADEQYFGYTYSAEVLGKGQTEAELWATDRRGKDDGHFDAQDYRLELEHGVTDRFNVAGYVNFAGHHVRTDDERIDRDLALRGLSAEFKYQILSPYKDGFGLTLYAEPAWSKIHGGGEKGTEYELEFKALVQKNFLDDRLVWAANFTFEPEWEKEKEADEDTGEVEVEWEKELKLEVSSGLTYRVANGWYAGVEGRYSSVYPDWTNGLHRETYAVFAGPVIHYGGKRFWATLSYQPQLFGGPSPGGSRALEEFEERELRLKIGYNF
jgi:hypothetical protein